MSANLFVIGDLHLDRSLPHRQIKKGRDDRYEFRLELFKEMIKDRERILLLGDVTDVPNLIDGKIMYDFLEAIKGKQVFQLLGNHDRHNVEGCVSMGEIIGQFMDSYQICTDVRSFVWGQFAFVLSSYYASEGDIMEATEKAVETRKKTVVFGHWNFYNEMMGGKKISPDWVLKMAEKGVQFFLGHLHNPEPILIQEKIVGRYLGVLSPLRFKEQQGYCLDFDLNAGKITKVHYPRGEEFVEFRYGDDLAGKYLGNEHAYFKITYNPEEYRREELKEELEHRFRKCRLLILVAEPREIKEVIQEANESFETEEEFIQAIAEEKGYTNTERIIEKHIQIKEGA